MSNQATLEGGDLWHTLDMTAGLYGMQYKLRMLAGINLDLSRFRKVTVRGSFEDMPFRDAMFSLVLYDPPHTVDTRNTLEATMGDGSGDGPHLATFKYGSYPNLKALRESLARGFKEAHRVLTIDGDLVFKWSSSEKPFSWADDTGKRAAPGLEKTRIMKVQSHANWRNLTMYAWYRKRF